MLIDPAKVPLVLAILRPESFYREKHVFVFQAMVSLFERGEGINQITVAHELASGQNGSKGTTRLEAIGGTAYLSHLIAEMPTSVYAEHYAGVVEKTSFARQLMDAGHKIEAIGQEGPADTDKAMADAMGHILELHGQRPGRRHSMSPKRRGDLMFDRYDILRENEDAHAVMFGFEALDKATGGAHESDLIIVGGRTGMGKSTLLRQMAFSMAQVAPVLFASAEMSGTQLMDRDISYMIGVHPLRLSKGLYNDDLTGQIMDAVGALTEIPIHDFIPPILTTTNLWAEAVRLRLSEGLAAVFVDYLQLLGDPRGRGNEQERVQSISARLKALAREVEVPVIAAAQLNRGPEYQANKRPRLSDLRSSGAIEQDADLVLLMYRDDYYRRNDNAVYKGDFTEIAIAKQRQGYSGITVRLRWDDKKQRLVAVADVGV